MTVKSYLRRKKLYRIGRAAGILITAAGAFGIIGTAGASDAGRYTQAMLAQMLLAGMWQTVAGWCMYRYCTQALRWLPKQFMPTNEGR